MKNFRKLLLCFALGVFFFPHIAWAEEFEFETIRTAEAPGFFMLKVFASRSAQPMQIQNVFVKNFDPMDAAKYAEIIPAIKDFGGEVIERTGLQKSSLRRTNRIISLGKPIGDFVRFEPKSVESSLEDFEKFVNESLPPVFLQNLTVKFGGNITNFYLDTKDIVGQSPIIIIGKFQEKMKTRVEITGTTQDGEITMESDIALNDDNLSLDPMAPELPQIWEEFYTKTKSQTQELGTSVINAQWKWEFFPMVLIISGSFFILLGLFWGKRKDPNKIFSENFLEETTPIDQKWEIPAGIPFELEKDEDSEPKDVPRA